MTDATAAGSELAAEIQARMIAALPGTHDHPDLDEFYELLRDYPTRGGKMLRGRLLVHAAEAFGGDLEAALSVAAALELFQNWVLIHDDVEDDSDERRGRPALHRRVGMPLAVNVGDALHVYMWDLLHRLQTTHRTADRVRAEFLHTIHRTAEGQHLDLAWVSQGRFDIDEADYLRMVVLKTSWYTVTAPLRLGALCADAAPPSQLTEAGADLGAAFQIRDDVLNLLPDAGAYGKEFAGDLYEGKRTLILAHLFAHAGAADREELTARLGKPRSERTAGDVERVLAAIERYGSAAYAQKRAEDLARRGLASLRQALAGAPDRAAVEHVVGLLETLAARRA